MPRGLRRVLILAEGRRRGHQASAARSSSVRYDDSGVKTYKLHQVSRSNQGTCINQRPIVWRGRAG